MIELVILGEPQHKQRPRFNRHTGIAYTPDQTTNYENLIRHEYMSKYGHMAFDDEEHITAEVTACFALPKSDFCKHGLSKSGKEKESHGWRCNTRADADNVAKVCLDALNGVAYPDDRLICDLHVRKRWAKEPKVIIHLWREYEQETEVKNP